MAVVFALSLVPAGAFAENAVDPDNIANHSENGDHGVLGTNVGTITIANTKDKETYEVYRLFELASFDDEDTNTAVHGTDDQDEAYSYVIDLAQSGGTYTNKWATFLTTQGPAAGTPYAVLSKASDNTSLPAEIDRNEDGIITLDEAAEKGVYFVIDSEAVTIKGADGNAVSTYHHITATSKFSNAWDSPNSQSSRIDPDGTTHDVDYTQPYSADDPETAGVNEYKPGYGVVQDFAKAALSYATTQGIAPNYVETGVGKPNTAAESQDSNENGGSVTVNARAKAEGATGYAAADGTDYDGTSKVPLGYYLVGTTMGTLASLDTTNREVDIYDKNDEPEIEKSILKKGSEAGGVQADDLVGGTAEYIAAATAAAYENWQNKKEVSDGMTGTAEGYAEAVQATADAKAAYDRLAASSPVWVKDTDADFEDYVQFRTVVTAQQGAKGYVIHDVMEQGLDLVTTTPTDIVNDRYTSYSGDYLPKVYLVRGEHVYVIPRTLEGKTYANYVFRTGSDDGNCGECDFEVVLNDIVRDDGDNPYATLVDAGGTYLDVKDGDKIVVTYWARIDKELAAVWCDSGESEPGEDSAVKDNSDNALEEQCKYDCNGNWRNDNYTVLTYGNKSHTQWDKASATVYSLDIAKTDAYDLEADENLESYKRLEGAKFSVYKTVDAEEALEDDEELKSDYASYTYTPEGGDETTVYYRKDKPLSFDADSKPVYYYNGDVATDDATTVAQLETTKSGALQMLGLEAWTYIVVEDEAPAGYNKLANPIVVTITGDVDTDGVAMEIPDGSGDFTANPEWETDQSDPQGRGYDDDEGTITYTAKANDGSVSTTTRNSYDYNGTTADKYQAILNLGDQTPIYVTNGGLHIINQTGQELPSTGGIGTTIFYVAGTVLVVGAAVMLVAKRRMGAEA